MYQDQPQDETLKRLEDLENEVKSLKSEISGDDRALRWILQNRNSLEPGHSHTALGIVSKNNPDSASATSGHVLKANGSGASSWGGLDTLLMDATPDSDLGYNGLTIQLVANENQAIGDVCYINADGEAQLGDASAIATSRIVVMATGTILANATGTYLLKGIIRNDAWNWSVGGPIYLTITGTSTNTLSQTPPAAPTESIVLLGYGTHADRLYFNPQEEKDTIDVQIFTGDGTWTKPATVGKSQPNRIFVEIWGAGGSGGAANANGVGAVGAGGGGGGYISGWFDPDTLDATEAVVVGTGGTAVTATNGNYTAGNVGENSTFDILTAYGGGGGGAGNAANRHSGGGGAGSTGVGAVGAVSGGAGGGVAGAPGSPIGGTGGASDGTTTGGHGHLGGGGGAGTADSIGGNAAYGGGGGGGVVGDGAGGAGGTSIYGGAGGQGQGTADGSTGSVRGGGGGGAFKDGTGTATSGAGGRGEVRVYTFF